MTVAVQTIFTASTANGVTTVFPYSFKITDADDLAVTVDGVLQTSGYTVSGVGDASGNVTFTTAPANLAKVVRYLAPVLKREEDYQQFGDWLADIVNRDFDRLWLALQAKSQDTSRSIKLPIDTVDDQTIEEDAATRAGKFISFDSYGNVTLSVLADLTVLSAVSAFMETLLDDANAAAACATLGARQESDDVRLAAGKVIIGEGTTEDAFETTLNFGEPTADRTVTLPDKSGTVAVTADIINLPAPSVGAEHKGKVAVITDDAGTSGWGRGGVSATAIATTSGTAQGWTGIPSWARRIIVGFVGISTNGTSALLLQIGDSGGYESTGYVGATTTLTHGNTVSVVESSAGFPLRGSWSATILINGKVTLDNLDGNIWAISGSINNPGVTSSSFPSGTKELSATLDRIQLTMANGTDAFDAGLLTMSYE